ncbi:MAG TPA: DUF3341 domain-containing protein [Verrucomicrobiales bacterium]|nr:DUF3341 domain-containing protein [Verrucomicrobiales bacterium]HCN75736.1 DUF3341 domain-containing protein [Verrucomicrobiales bacterium]HRJ10061.1 DUF3341 domain-containing protein [Prosthecobacter sp.]HRK16379.1 DUF3341 domain-containing protein [Prosthecobacter sp.]
MSTTLKRVHGFLAEFDSVKDLYHAAEHVRDAGYQRWDVHSPFPIHGMDHAMGVKRSKLPWLVFFGGMTGTCVAFFLQTITQTTFWSDIGLSFLQTLAETYPTVVQGKPTHIWTLPAFFPVMFELTILFSAFTTLFGLMGLIGLPRLNHPLFTSKRFGKFSDDGFFVCIEARDPKFSQEGTKSFLEKIGGKNVELVEDEI